MSGSGATQSRRAYFKLSGKKKKKRWVVGIKTLRSQKREEQKDLSSARSFGCINTKTHLEGAAETSPLSAGSVPFAGTHQWDGTLLAALTMQCPQPPCVLHSTARAWCRDTALRVFGPGGPRSSRRHIPAQRRLPAAPGGREGAHILHSPSSIRQRLQHVARYTIQTCRFLPSRSSPAFCFLLLSALGDGAPDGKRLCVLWFLEARCFLPLPAASRLPWAGGDSGATAGTDSHPSKAFWALCQAAEVTVEWTEQL